MAPREYDLLVASPLAFADAVAAVRAAANPEQAAIYGRFFKTGRGEYGEGDRFLGVRVPVLRAIAARFAALPHAQVLRLLGSEFHEHRLLALLIWTLQYRKGDPRRRQRITRDYLRQSRYVNNWDLVDASAYHLLGPADPDGTALLPRLARSSLIWERRMAIVATMHHLRQGDAAPTFEIAQLLVHDEHDLIHKAVGWLLREAGKLDLSRLESFLERHGPTMPRTTLRYAIERFTPQRRKAYLAAMPQTPRRRKPGGPRARHDRGQRCS